MDGPGVLLCRLQRFGTVRIFDQAIARARERGHRQVTHQVIVLGEEYRLITGAHRAGCAGRRHFFEGCIRFRQVDAKARPLPWLALDADVTVVLPDDTVASGEPEARSMPESLAGKERLEQVLTRLSAQTLARVLHLQLGVTPARRSGKRPVPRVFQL